MFLCKVILTGSLHSAPCCPSPRAPGGAEAEAAAGDPARLRGPGGSGAPEGAPPPGAAPRARWQARTPRGSAGPPRRRLDGAGPAGRPETAPEGDTLIISLSN